MSNRLERRPTSRNVIPAAVSLSIGVDMDGDYVKHEVTLGEAIQILQNIDQAGPLGYSRSVELLKDPNDPSVVFGVLMTESI